MDVPYGRRVRLQSAALAKLLAVLSFAALLSSCGASARPDASTVPRSLLLQSRPIGHGASFQLSAMGPVLGTCRAGRGPRAGVHIEVFAENRVVLVPAGIGTRPPLRCSSAQAIRRSASQGFLGRRGP